jgi:paraquat-inducible protein B
MAEVEYKGLKVGGSQWLVILPLLGTIVGGLWGGFQLYDRLLDAETKLSKLNPTQILNQVEMFKESSELELQNLQDLTTVIKDDLAEDITEAVRLARKVETDTASTQRQIRNDVYEMEREMQNRFREMDADIRNNKKDLEEKIETILENPLNDVE